VSVDLALGCWYVAHLEQVCQLPDVPGYLQGDVAGLLGELDDLSRQGNALLEVVRRPDCEVTGVQRVGEGRTVP
jgi:hypothetical protein